MNKYNKYIFPILFILVICIFIKQESYINSGLYIDSKDIQKPIPFNKKLPLPQIHEKIKGVNQTSLEMNKLKEKKDNIENTALMDGRKASERNKWIDLPNNPNRRSYYRVRECSWDESGITNTHVVIKTKKDCENFDYVNYIPFANPASRNGLRSEKPVGSLMGMANNWVKPMWTN